MWGMGGGWEIQRFYFSLLMQAKVERLNFPLTHCESLTPSYFVLLRVTHSLKSKFMKMNSLILSVLRGSTVSNVVYLDTFTVIE